MGRLIGIGKRKEEKQQKMTEDEKKLILPELSKIEKEYGVIIVFAVESGARSFNLQSPDSDYDVRILYIHHVDFYLRVDESEQKHEIIFKVDDKNLDFHGYELRKALQLLRKSNPSLLEWLQSDCIFYEYKPIMNQIRALSNKPPVYDRTCAIHYFHSIARQNWIEYIKSFQLVNRKKYFYILRSLFQAEYMRIHEKKDCLPPLNFENLMSQIEIPENYQSDVRYLVERKKKESGQWVKESRMPGIDKYILELRESVKKYASMLKRNKDCEAEERCVSEMNKIIISAVKQFDIIPSVTSVCQVNF